MPLSRPRALAVILTIALPGSPVASRAQWIPYTNNPKTILEGNWQSCPDRRTGVYAERVYDHVVAGVGQYEVHLGPKREFAIFPGVQDEHREHGSQANLLKPYRVPMDNMRARQSWKIPSLKLSLTVTMGGGSTTDCESWYVILEPLKEPSE